ncbi:MAG: DUF4159 domain-containing protein [bacterium]
MAKQGATTGQSFIIALILHGAILLILGAYIAYTQSPPVKEWVASTFLKAQKEVKPKERPKDIKPIMRPTIPTEQPMPIQDVQIVPRVTTAAVMRAPRAVAATEVLEFDDAPVARNVVINANVPRVRVAPSVVTYANIPTTSSPEAISFSAPVAAAPAAPSVGRGIVGTQVRVAKGAIRPQGLSMIKNITVADTGLANVAQAVTLGKVAVAPLPKGEPGGRVIGRGKDIEGVFRFTRVQHALADWWADQSSLVALAEWLNTQTKIKTDMNVEGGAIRLTDPKLSKCPLVFFTGHDPANVRSQNLARGEPIKNRLSEQEKDGMRKYLIEDGGFIYFDDCGVNAPAQAFLRLTLAQLRYAMPEYSVDRIPNDHEIYNNFYEMGGPPVGFDIFWWGTHPPKRNFLEGITIGDHLGVLVCRRDYMCAMESVSLPTRTVHYSPGVYRFSTNVVVYSLTHGGISDYSKYVPEDRTADRIQINAPTVVPTLQ